MVNAEIRITDIPQIGPAGLTVTTNERVEPIGYKDLFEVLRWMREDLLKIHKAFSHVHNLRSEMTTIKAINLKQKLAFEEMGRTQAESEFQMAQQAEAMQALSTTQTVLAGVLEKTLQRVDEMQSKIIALDEYARKPWWKKVLG